MEYLTASFIAVLTLAAAVPGAYAGTTIESHDDVGGSSTVKIQGFQARIDNGNDSGYMLIDMRADKVYSVSNDDRMVLDASSPIPPDEDPYGAGQGGTPPAPTVTKVGSGPTIAGFPTIHYRIMVGEEHCYDEYLAPKPLENHEVLRFTQTMSKWSSRLRRNTAPSSEVDDACDAVVDALNEQYPTLGIPMRTVDGAGTVIHEVTRIQGGETFPARLFKLPAEYPVITQRDLVRRVQKLQDSDTPQAEPDQMEEMQQNMEDMLRQMQEQE